MPVHVHVPLQVRVPHAPGSRHLALLETAVGDAVRRALEASSEHAPVSAHTHQRIVVHPLHFQFVGPPASASLNEAVQRAVGAGCSFALKHGGIISPVSPALRLPRALTPSVPAERMDHARLDLAAGAYRIPVYDDGEDVAVPVQQAGNEPATSEGSPDEGPTEAVALREALEMAWAAHLSRVGRPTWQPEAHGYPGFYGRITVNGATFVGIVYLSDVPRPQERLMSGASWRPLPVRFIRRPREGEDFVWQTLELRGFDFVLTNTGRAATVENLVSALRSNRPAGATQRSDVDDLATARELARTGQVVYRLEGTATPHVLVGPSDGDSPIKFVAAVRWAVPEPDATGGGMGGLVLEGEDGDGGAARVGGGTGDGTGVGEGAGAGRGAREESFEDLEGPFGWPAPPEGARVLPCTPVGGEPSLAELQGGGDELRHRMERLAELLSLPTCDYVGRFCLNAAHTLGARAQQMGLLSVSDGARTEVGLRPDGTGNNGLVDVRPVVSPPLRGLKTLAAIVPRLTALAEQLRNAYRQPENEGVIRRDGEPRAAWRWERDFIERFHDRFSLSCAYLYAEACRVILLQQLRSSRQFIEARRSPQEFDRTKLAFDAALGTLGETLVTRLALRRALRDARLRPYRMLMVPGAIVTPTQADVGAAGLEELYRALTDPQGWQPSAPAGTRVEHRGGQYQAWWQDRWWTEQELEESIHTTRGLLNLVDPLFKQVEEIEAVFREFRADPGSTASYLRQLLDEMATANAEIVRECEDPLEGGFYALTTSRYIVSQARGRLRYDLQGLHKLADDELRPYAGSDLHYEHGINRAIGREASMDALIELAGGAGIIVLGLLCAPLGVVAAGAITGTASLTFTALEYQQALEKEQVFRSLRDPELILSWQEIELAFLTARLSAMFSVFDAVAVGKGVRAAVETASKALRQGVRVTASEAAERVIRNLTGELMELALKQAATEAVVEIAMDQVLSTVLAPAVEDILRESAIQHGAGFDPEPLQRLPGQLAGEEQSVGPEEGP